MFASIWVQKKQLAKRFKLARFWVYRPPFKIRVMVSFSHPVVANGTTQTQDLTGLHGPVHSARLTQQNDGAAQFEAADLFVGDALSQNTLFLCLPKT